MKLQIPEIKLGAVINRGGHSVIYEAQDLRAREKRAVKVLLPEAASDSAVAKSFKNEVKLLQEFPHENLLTAYSSGVSSGVPYIVMEYFPGRNLKNCLLNREPVLRQWWWIAQETAEALLHLHLKGLVHRDVKPENVLLSDDGRVKLIDLSIAQRYGFKLFSLGRRRVQGSPSYMSPEQISGKATDPRSDIYSFGVMLYELLSGSPPFTGRTQEEILQAHMRERPRPLEERASAIDAETNKFVLKMLEKKPENRYPDMNFVLYQIRSARRRLEKPETAVLSEGERGSTRILIQRGSVTFDQVKPGTPFHKPNKNRGTVLNLGRSGVGFLSNQSLQNGITLIIHLFVPPEPEPIPLRARVVWCRQVEEEGFYSIGVVIDEAGPKYQERFEDLRGKVVYGS